MRQLAAPDRAGLSRQPLHLIGVLNGASIFLSDLIRQIPLEVSLDFMAVSSYGLADSSSGEVRVTKDLDTSIEGLNVILVEDILDTGFTINYLQRILLQRHPRTLRVAVLLDKAGRRVQPCPDSLCRLPHPQSVRRGLWPGLRRALPQPERRLRAVRAGGNSSFRATRFARKSRARRSS